MFKEIKRKKKIKRAKEMAASALVGGVITGSVVALLTPKSGKELREDIKDTAVKCTDKVKETIEEKALEAKEKANKIKADLKEKKDKAKKKTAEVLKDAAEHLEESTKDNQEEDNVQ